MGRPPGAQNKLTRERDTAARLLAEEYGDPLEDMLQKRARWQQIYAEQLAKPSRHRNPKKLAEAEEKIRQYNNDIMPFMRPKYNAINHATDEAPRPTVIRAPESISDSREWLQKYAPKRDEAVNDRPTLPFVKNLRASLDTATAVGIDDAGEIVNEAIKQTKLDG